MSIERIFRSLKHSRGLKGHCMRGVRKITFQAAIVSIVLPGYGVDSSQGW